METYVPSKRRCPPFRHTREYDSASWKPPILRYTVFLLQNLEISSNFDIQRSVHRDILSELKISWLCRNMMLSYRHKYCCIVSKQYIPETLWFTLYTSLFEAKYSWPKQHAVLLNLNWYSFTDRLKLVRINWVHSKYHCEKMCFWQRCGWEFRSSEIWCCLTGTFETSEIDYSAMKRRILEEWNSQ
jgi:hypothetical protein